MLTVLFCFGVSVGGRYTSKNCCPVRKIVVLCLSLALVCLVEQLRVVIGRACVYACFRGGSGGGSVNNEENCGR